MSYRVFKRSPVIDADGEPVVPNLGVLVRRVPAKMDVIEFSAGEQTSSLSFRLDQLERADDTGEQLVLLFEERDGIAKIARLTTNGLDVELFHILTFT